RHNKARDLIQLGAYSPGHDTELDTAVRLHDPMVAMLQQSMHESAAMGSSVQQLRAVIGG
ncbi:MAG: flagellum-specific ATP synthase FliI, partial [Burkholderiales bacterium]